MSSCVQVSGDMPSLDLPAAQMLQLQHQQQLIHQHASQNIPTQQASTPGQQMPTFAQATASPAQPLQLPTSTATGLPPVSRQPVAGVTDPGQPSTAGSTPPVGVIEDPLQYAR